MEQELRRNDFFLRKIFGKYVFASVLSMLATSVAGMIDTVLVGWFLGETGLAAMSLVSPVYLFYYTIGAVIGMGAPSRPICILEKTITTHIGRYLPYPSG